MGLQGVKIQQYAETIHEHNFRVCHGKKAIIAYADATGSGEPAHSCQDPIDGTFAQK